MTYIEALQKYVDEKEECVIYLEHGDTFVARISEIGEDFIRLDEGDSESIMDINKIVRVRTYPKNEKGKKKAIFT